MLQGKRITIVTGDPTRQENPEKKFATSWARVKIKNSLPRKWGTTPS